MSGLKEAREFQTLHTLAIKESLDKALTAAGGTPLSVDRLVETSALSLLAMLAPNGIRFSFIDDNDEVKKYGKIMQFDQELEPGVISIQRTDKDRALVYQLGKGLSIKVGADGVWIEFTTESGSSALFHVGNIFGRGAGAGSGVIDTTVKQWIMERQLDREELLPMEASQ